MNEFTELEKLLNEAYEQACVKFHEKKYEVVVVLVEQLLKISPNHHDAMQLLGTAYHALKRHVDAQKCFSKCLELDSNNPETLNNIAICHSVNNEFDVAIVLLEKALSMKPDSPSLLANLGLQYRHKHDYEKALFYYKKSLSEKNTPTTLAMIGGCYGELKNLDEAEKYIREAILMDSQFHPAYIDLASILHLKGNLKDGFEAYEKRFEVFEQLKIWQKIYDPSKKWNGENISGKKILVHTEQGNGDTIHFLRYLKLLKEKNAFVILHCSDVMSKLCEPFADEIFMVDPHRIPIWNERGNNDFVPSHHYHCSIISLPHLLNMPAIPECPYIKIDEKIDLRKYDNKTKIGIVWGGNAQHPNDRFRSCKLEYFRKIYNLPNVKLFSLMKDYRSRTYDGKNIVDLTDNADDMKIVDMSSFMKTYYDTACIINSLDMVVGVDTSVIHLSGAMGKKTICMLPWNPDWRWGLERNNTIWYSTVQLVRQKTMGEWSDVFTIVENQIKKACELSHAQ